MSGKEFDNKVILDKLLTANRNGWKLDLFVSIDDDYICEHCKNISKSAITLMCEFEREEDEHKDEDIKLYCESCMKIIIKNNGNKCPVSNHSNAKYVVSRIARRKILKSHVLCPNSVQFQQKMNETENINDNNKFENNSGILYSTNEGNIAQKSKNDQGCTFEGTLGELIEEHIHVCIKKHLLFAQESNNNSNANQMRLYIMEDLQEKNIQMMKKIECLENQSQKNEQNIEALKKEMTLEMEAMRMEYNNKIKKVEQKLIENEMKMNEEVNKNQYLSQEIINIPLIIYSYRKARSDPESPANLLKSGKHAYASANVSEFAKDEKDWIIFEMNDKELNGKQMYIPTQIKFLNYTSSEALKSMVVWLGSVNNNEWQKLHSSNVIKDIEVQDQTLQTFAFDGCQSLRSDIVQKKWKHIKVEFVDNNGYTGGGCKFYFYEIQFHGKSVNV